MSNHARRMRLQPPESVPPLTGMPPAPSGDGVAQLIGQSVAYHVAQLLAPVLQRLVDQQEQPACIVCAAKAKRAERDYEVAARNAQAAAEPPPDKPDAKVSQSFTQGARGPVCWGCFDPDADCIEPESFMSLNEKRAAQGLPPYGFPEADLPVLAP